MDVASAIPIASADELHAWFREHAADAREVIVAVYLKSSGRQTIGLRGLQEVATCHGWVDTQTQHIDRERYAARFVPRRAGSRWGPKNRVMARRLLEEGRLTPAGIASLPDDL